jgi:hypothetical protein
MHGTLRPLRAAERLRAWAAGQPKTLRRCPPLAGSLAGRYLRRMSAKPDLKRLAAAVRAAEQELKAASGRSALNAAARKLMRAKAELKAAGAKGANGSATASCAEAPEAAS